MEIIRTKLTPPDGYELDRENSTLEEIVWKPIKKEVTYEDICVSLFKDKKIFYMRGTGDIAGPTTCSSSCIFDLNNSTSILQVKKLLAYNKLMNIAEYLNEGWKPNWNNTSDAKYYINYGYHKDCFSIVAHTIANSGEVLFKSKELAEQAIKIMGQKDLNILFKS